MGKRILKKLVEVIKIYNPRKNRKIIIDENEETKEFDISEIRKALASQRV